MREFREAANVAVVDEAMDRSSVEAQIVSCTTSWCRDTEELGRELVALQYTRDLLQRGAHGQCFAGACCSEQEYAQWFDWNGVSALLGCDEFLHVSQNYVQKELLEIVVQKVAA